MLRLKATKTSLYKLVAEYVADMPPAKETDFTKTFRQPDYRLRWMTRDGDLVTAALYACLGSPLLTVEVTDGHTTSRKVHRLRLDGLKNRGIVEEFITAVERQRMEREASQ